MRTSALAGRRSGDRPVSTTSHNYESPVDRTNRILDGFFANMPAEMGCDRHVIQAWNGLPMMRCRNQAQIGLIEFEIQLCFECLDDFENGKLENYR